MKLLAVDEVRAALEASKWAPDDDVNAISVPDFHAFVAVCLFAGLRLGEAAGLQLGDVNFPGRSIRVDRQVQGATIKTVKLVAPKYGSERTVYVPDELTRILSAHVARNAITKSDELLLRTPLGHMWNQNNAAGEWRRIRETAGLREDITLHALRHTFASNLIASGCDVVTVQRALGHSQPSITLNVHSHLWPTAEDKTRAATANFMSSVMDSADYTRTAPGKSQVRGSSQR